MSSSLFNAMSHPIKRSPDKVSYTCTPRNTPHWFSKGLVSASTKEQHETSVILKYEVLSGIAVSLMCQTFDVLPFVLQFFLCDV
jgi:hypothetical protein